MTQLTLTLISGAVISGIAAYLGTLMLSKKMSVVAGPLAHLALPGVALAIIYDFSIALGAFPFVILGAYLIWILEKKTKLPMENLAAIIFAFGVGVALLILPISQAEEALVGNITNITGLETAVAAALSFGVFILLRTIYRPLMLMNIHEDFAAVEGVNTNTLNLLYLLSIAIAVPLAVYLVGGLITVALIAIPAASAKNVSHDLRSYQIWSIIFGSVAAVTGILIAHYASWPAGPMVIITSASMFLGTVFIHKNTS